MNDSVRLSLRLLTTGRFIEREVDALMRARFDSTIARFDFLSALDRHGALTLGEVRHNTCWCRTGTSPNCAHD